MRSSIGHEVNGNVTKTFFDRAQCFTTSSKRQNLQNDL